MKTPGTEIIHSPESIYTLGGAVQAGEGVYIERGADQELLDHCLDNTFAYVLTARQMGKSSLMERTSLKLREQGVHTALIDLNGLDKASLESPEVWYLDFISIFTEFVPVSFDTYDWWQEHGSKGLVRRFKDFFQSVLLEEVTGQIVVFVDEIDATYDLPFADDFFAAVRSMHEKRALESIFDRISFVLIGVATPSELIKDPRRTPFNIGQSVELSDFTLAEAFPFTGGWNMEAEQAKKVLEWGMKWTGGHPNLTQKLCHAIALDSGTGWTEKKVHECIRKTFFDSNKRDSNLEYINTQMTRGAHWDQLGVLKTYKEIRRKAGSVLDDTQSRAKVHLKLHGIVVNKEGHLSVRNAIYTEYFGTKWLKEHWPINWWQQIPRSVLILNGLLILSLIGIIWQQQRVNQQAELVETEQERRINSENRETLTAQQLDTAQDSIEAITKLRAEQAQRLASLREEFEATNDSISSLLDTLSGSSGYIEDLQSDLDSTQVSITDLNRLQIELEQQLEERTRDISEVSSSLQYSDQVAEVLQSVSTIERVLNLGRRVEGAVEALNAYSLLKQLELHKEYQGSDGEVMNAVYASLRLAINALSSERKVPLELAMKGSEWVRTVKYSKDGQYILAGNSNGGIYIWDRNSRSTPIGVFEHAHSITTLEISPDSEWFVFGTNDGTVNLINSFRNPRVIATQQMRNRILALDISPDANWIAMSSAGGGVVLWNPRTSTRRVLKERMRGIDVSALAFSPDGNKLLLGSRSGSLELIDLVTEETLYLNERAHSSLVLSVAFHPNEPIFLSGSENPSVHVWSYAEDIRQIELIDGHEGATYAIAFNQEGSVLVTGSGDKSVQVRDWSNRKTKNPTILQEHTNWVYSVAIDESSNVVLSGSRDGRILEWIVNPEVLAQEVCLLLETELEGDILTDQLTPVCN